MDKNKVSDLIESVIEAALDAGSQGPAMALFDVGDKQAALEDAARALYAELGIPFPGDGEISNEAGDK